MTQFHPYQVAVSIFHSAIDFEQENNNKEAYQKYAEGLSLIGFLLKNDVHLLHNSVVLQRHKQLLEFVRKSTERLLIILKNTDFNNVDDVDGKKNDYGTEDTPSNYQTLTESLPGIVTTTQTIPLNVFYETTNFSSPLSLIEEQNKHIIKIYENRAESIISSQDKINLQLELQRRLAENVALAKKHHGEWEIKRKLLSKECQQIAQEKFDIHHKIETGTVKDSDFTKQNLYAACLQCEKEFTWAKDLNHKIRDNSMKIDVLKITLTYVLQHELHPLACMLRQIQQKSLHKLTRLVINNLSVTRSEVMVYEEYFKKIVLDIKEDLFMLATVIHTLWEQFSSEETQQIVVDIIHHLYFPPIKPYLIQLLRIILHEKETKIKEYMETYETVEFISYPIFYYSVLNELHQLPTLHSPSTMMVFVVDILKSFIKLNFNIKDENSFLALGIDEIMPKLIQLILASKMASLPSEITFIENFMPAKRALGEEGYSVTLFQSVLSYISDKNIS